MLKNHAPKVAGEDTLEGGARHPQRFDEPDEEALEEMAKLLGKIQTKKPDSSILHSRTSPLKSR